MSQGERNLVISCKATNVGLFAPVDCVFHSKSLTSSKTRLWDTLDWHCVYCHGKNSYDRKSMEKLRNFSKCGKYQTYRQQTWFESVAGYKSLRELLVATRKSKTH
jgi:hypothetical protein